MFLLCPCGTLHLQFLLFQQLCFKMLFVHVRHSCIFLVDINDPISQKADFVVDQTKVDMLLQFGFQEAIAKKALRASVSTAAHLPHMSVTAKERLKEGEEKRRENN